MFRLFKSFDWRKSKAHLLLLSKFIHANRFEDFAKHDYWKHWWDSLLGEPSQKAIKRFIDEGMLMTPDLNDLLSYKHKVPELKDMLKQRGLPVSGRKEEMIERLVQTDPDGMRKAVAELSLLICTQRGHEIAEQYIEAKKEKHAQVERLVMEYLSNRKFKEVILTVNAYEAEHEFPDEMAIKYTAEQRIEKLKAIFESKPPKILGKLENEKLEALRIAAAMMTLWGENKAKQWLPANFETGLSYDCETVVRMFVFQATHKGTLERYRKSGVDYVEILPAPDSCESCKKLAGKRFKLNEAPELPNPSCTHKMGCRCKYLPCVD